MNSILLIDIPVVPVNLPEMARPYIQKKLFLEAKLRQTRLPGVVCPALPYTRGLLTVAAALQEAGYGINYIVWSDPKDRLRLRELSRSASVIGITCMTSGHDVAASIAAEVRNINRNAFIILGGPHATALGARLLDEIPALDCIVRGHGHNVMVEIAQSAPFVDGLPGVSTRRCPDDAVRSESYSDFPMPAYNLLYRPLSEYAHSLRTSHGCPYGCSFCVERLTWNKDSFSNLDCVYHELKTILPFMREHTLIHFSDPIFNMDMKRSSVLCEWLSSYASRFYFSMDTRLDKLSADQLADLKRAGCRYLRIGLESLGPTVMKKANKGWLPSDADEILNNIHELASDIIIHGYWITGLPGSTTDTLRQSVYDAQYLVKSKLVTILSNKVLVPYPGTIYYNDPKSFDMTLLERPWRAFDRLSPPVFNLDGLTAAEIYNAFALTEKVIAETLHDEFAKSLDSNIPTSFETYKALAYLDEAAKVLV